MYTVRTVTVTLYPDHLIDRPCYKGDWDPKPNDVPVFGKGSMIGYCREEYPLPAAAAGHYVYEYMTLERFENVLAFFREEPVKDGWILQGEDDGPASAELTFKKPGRIGKVQIGIDRFLELPSDILHIRIMKTDEYEDTSVKIRIDNGS